MDSDTTTVKPFEIPCVGCGCCCSEHSTVELNLNEWDAKHQIPWKYIDCSVRPPVMKKKTKSMKSSGTATACENPPSTPSTGCQGQLTNPSPKTGHPWSQRVKMKNKELLEATPHQLKLLMEQIPFVDAEEVKILFVVDMYDGMLGGVCKYKNKEYYFSCIEENDGSYGEWYRRFALLELTEEQIGKEHECDRRFETDVKQHSHDSQEFKKFYEDFGNYDRSYPDSEVIGWFED